MRSYSKYWLCAVLLFFFLNSCKKNYDSNFINYIKGKIDGAPFECNALIHATKASPGLGTIADPTVRISGSIWGQGEKSIQLFLNHETSSITTGTYNFQPDKDRSAFLAEDLTLNYAGFCPSCPIAFTGTGSITITGITTKYVKGTFAFTTGPNGISNGGAVRVITEGEFHVQRF